MRPHLPIVAQEFSQLLATDIAPNLTGFRANNVHMMSFMLKMMAEEWDRAASRLVDENRAIRGLLRQAATALGDDSLARAADTEDSDLKVSVLEAENDRLRTLLIDIHARAEQAEGPAVRALEDAIWEELRHSVERRRVSLANF